MISASHLSENLVFTLTFVVNVFIFLFKLIFALNIIYRATTQFSTIQSNFPDKYIAHLHTLTCHIHTTKFRIESGASGKFDIISTYLS